jgi:hypothetical protein
MSPTATTAIRSGVGIADDLRKADREAVGVSRSLEQNRELLVADAGFGAQSAAPLFQNDAALLDDVGGVEECARRPVFEDLEALLHELRLVRGNREDEDRLVEAGVGVEVGPESHTDRLQILHDVVLPESTRPVEQHVLDEVRHAPLIVVFLDRPGVHDEPELDAFFRTGVAADEVA